MSGNFTSKGSTMVTKFKKHCLFLKIFSLQIILSGVQIYGQWFPYDDGHSVRLECRIESDTGQSTYMYTWDAGLGIDSQTVVMTEQIAQIDSSSLWIEFEQNLVFLTDSLPNKVICKKQKGNNVAHTFPYNGEIDFYSEWVYTDTTFAVFSDLMRIDTVLDDDDSLVLRSDSLLQMSIRHNDTGEELREIRLVPGIGPVYIHDILNGRIYTIVSWITAQESHEQSLPSPISIPNPE